MSFYKFLFWWKRSKKIIKYSTIKFINSLTEIPTRIGKDIYVVGSEGHYKWVVFRCPIHKANRIEVNLMKTREPHWNLSISSNQRLTLWPSIVVTESCSCHFWIKESKAHMC